MENTPITTPVVVEERLLTQVVLRAKAQRLALRGVNATKAAEMLGVSSATMREIYRDVEFRRAVMARIGDVFEDVDEKFEQSTLTLHERLEQQAMESFEELVSIAKDVCSPPSLKAKIHLSFLDRVAESAQKNVSIDGKALQARVLADAAATAREMDNVIPFRKAQ